MDKIQKLLKDAELHIEEAQKHIVEWTIKLRERERFLNTIEIIKKEKPNELP